MPKTISKYGASWRDDCDALEIEFDCIKRGGTWKNKRGETCGLGLFEHYMNARKLIWPNRYRHRWTELLYREFLRNQFTVMMGAASTQKTSHASEFCLLDYWVFPLQTLVLVSTTTREKLDLSVFGEIKMLFKEGTSRFPWLAGNLIDYMKCIATDDIGDGEGRDVRRGLIGRACYVGQRWVGLGVFAGIKQERVRFLCDEMQWMEHTVLGCLPNMFSNPDCKVFGSGNPNHDPDCPLGLAAEPLCGWSSHPEPQKTEVWDTKFYGGRCVNLVGTDSPNFDVPDGEKEPYPRLIGRKFEKIILHNYGENSPEHYTQVKGVMNLSLAHAKVITRQLCKDHGAEDRAIWSGEGARIKLYSLDPAYGGGDRCVGIPIEFGESIDGSTILRPMGPVKIFQIKADGKKSPEDQIADLLEAELTLYGIASGNVFYDSFGKGTVGFAFARKFGANSPVPVDSGAMPSERPVRQDEYVIDQITGLRRLKTCKEHYSKFVSEMWFSVRYAIEGNQIRELTDDIIMEGCWREYDTVKGNKIEIEPKKEMREKKSKSPDIFDGFAIGVEGARRLGFMIGRLGDKKTFESKDNDFLESEEREYNELIKSKLLVHHT